MMTGMITLILCAGQELHLLVLPETYLLSPSLIR
jgi:hypothetical protein